MFELTEKIAAIATSRLGATEETAPDFANMQYPSWLPLMTFEVHQYPINGFGQLMIMDTKMVGGVMKLSTIVFTPSSGISVPFLLIDTMQMPGKNLAYVEYYDLTKDGADAYLSEKYKERFAEIPDYEETPAWYVERRTPYSLIKGGKGVRKEELDRIVLFCIDCYLESINNAEVKEENLEGLKKFQQEMVELGNPSTSTMSKVLGKEGADYFFQRIVMPIGKEQPY